MPRSGTTLTEQILAAHPQVHGAGELLELALVARSMPTRDGKPPGGSPPLEALAPGAIAWAAGRWLDGATRRAKPGARRLVDKEPLNFHLLGLAALMFPNARVIWCRRDPRDVAVSIYGENFSVDEPFATSMHGIGRYISEQERLMHHWRRVLPLPIVESRYERLVADLEGEARRLVAFLDVPWDPACLRFHRLRADPQPLAGAPTGARAFGRSMATLSGRSLRAAAAGARHATRLTRRVHGR
jgi:hypothetical protein